MRKKRKRSCPYCNSKISYIRALSEMSLGEHTCPKCNKNSNISYSKKIYIPAAVALAAAIAITAVIYFKESDMRLARMCAVIIIPFALFYFLSPLFYSLKPIKSQMAATPVIKQKQVSRKRSEITPSAVKYKEKKRLEREKISMEKQQKSFKSKLTRFVKTYIVVDEEEESKTSMPEAALDYEATDGKTRIARAIKDENIDEIKKKLADEKKSRRSKSEYDDYSYSYNDDYGYDSDNSKSPRNNSAYYEEEDPFNESYEEDLSTVASVSTDIPFRYEHVERKPVYHKLNKKTNVNFEYLSENIDFIIVDLNKKTEEEEENEEILSFFAQTPNNSQTEYSVFGVKQNNTETQEQMPPLPNDAAEIEKASAENRVIDTVPTVRYPSDGSAESQQTRTQHEDSQQELPEEKYTVESAEMQTVKEEHTADSAADEAHTKEEVDEISQAEEEESSVKDTQQKIKITRVFSLTDEEKERAAKENILRFDYFPHEKKTIAVSLESELPAKPTDNAAENVPLEEAQTENEHEEEKTPDNVPTAEEKTTTEVKTEKQTIPAEKSVEKYRAQEKVSFPQEDIAAEENSVKVKEKDEAKPEIDVRSIDGVEFINFFDTSYDNIVMEISDDDLFEKSFFTQTKTGVKEAKTAPTAIAEAPAEEVQSEEIALPNLKTAEAVTGAIPTQVTYEEKSVPAKEAHTQENITENISDKKGCTERETKPTVKENISQARADSTDKTSSAAENNSKVKVQSTSVRVPYERVYAPNTTKAAAPSVRTAQINQDSIPVHNVPQEQQRIQRRHRDYNKDTQQEKRQTAPPQIKEEISDNNISAGTQRTAAPVKFSGERHADKPVKSELENKQKPTEKSKLEQDIKDENVSFQQMIDLSEFQTSDFSENAKTTGSQSNPRSIDIDVNEDYEEDEEFNFEREIYDYEDDEEDYDTSYPYDMHGQADAAYIPLKNIPEKQKIQNPEQKDNGQKESEVPEQKAVSRYEKRFGKKNTPKNKAAVKKDGVNVQTDKLQRVSSEKQTAKVTVKKTNIDENNKQDRKNKTGFFAGLKEKLMAATEDEREKEHELEEKERKLAEKEARKKAKEKDKLAEAKKQESSDNAKAAAKPEDSDSKKQSTHSSNQAARQDAPQKQRKPRSKYEAQERIILESESVKRRIAAQAEADSRRITEEEKQRRIASIHHSEQDRSNAQRRQAEKEKLRQQKESEQSRKEQYRESEKKVEQLRRQQEAKAKARQQRIKQSDIEQRDSENVSLTDIDKVRTKVSQQQKQKQKKVDEFFSE